MWTHDAKPVVDAPGSGRVRPMFGQVGVSRRLDGAAPLRASGVAPQAAVQAGMGRCVAVAGRHAGTVAAIYHAIRVAYARSALTQGQIAARAQVSERTVAKALAGHRVIAHNLLSIAEALDVPVTVGQRTA